MKRNNFQKFFEANGDQLLHGWLRAHEDGNTELFSEWVIGEYEWTLENPKSEYEVPYHGILDNRSRAEKEGLA
jgi:hypothetical protein